MTAKMRKMNSHFEHEVGDIFSVLQTVWGFCFVESTGRIRTKTQVFPQLLVFFPTIQMYNYITAKQLQEDKPRGRFIG